MRLNQDVKYALMALIELESQSELSTARAISEKLKIPQGLLSKILQRLNRVELVTSTQGNRGGYKLARPLAAIRIGDVERALHGENHMLSCTNAISPCERADSCTIRGSLEQLQSAWISYLDSLTVESFAQLKNSKTPLTLESVLNNQ